MRKTLCAVIAAALFGCGCDGLLGEDEEAGLYSGVLEAVPVDVHAEVGGQVLVTPALEGAKINKGDVLLELDRSRYELALRAAKGELGARKAKLEAMEKGARAREVEQARLALQTARVQKEKAEKDYGRFQRLYEEQAVSEFERDNARVGRDLARDRAARAEEAYQLVLEGVRDEELRAQMSVVDAMEARVELSELDLDKTVIESPADGTLVERYLEVGELAMPGSIAATVSNYEKLEVRVYVPEDRVGALKPGQEAEVFTDSHPGKTFSGRVAQVSNEAEFTPKNVQTREERTTLVYEVKVLVDNPERWAVAGLPADVKFPGLAEPGGK